MFWDLWHQCWLCQSFRKISPLYCKSIRFDFFIFLWFLSFLCAIRIWKAPLLMFLISMLTSLWRASSVKIFFLLLKSVYFFISCSSDLLLFLRHTNKIMYSNISKTSFFTFNLIMFYKIVFTIKKHHVK